MDDAVARIDAAVLTLHVEREAGASSDLHILAEAVARIGEASPAAGAGWETLREDMRTATAGLGEAMAQGFSDLREHAQAHAGEIPSRALAALAK